MKDEQSILANELHAPARKHFETRKVVTLGINDLWQADIVDMQELSTRNKGHKYILTIIDTFSKIGYAIPLKTKSGEEVTNAFSTLFSTVSPKNLHTDEGKEFFNKNLKKVLKQYNVNHYYTYSKHKASIVERFNRTLKAKMWKEFTRLNTHNWLSIIEDLVDNYNNSYHRTIKMKPTEVKNNVDKVKSLLSVDKNANRNSKFKVDDIVRISKSKGIFEKSYKFNWSEELFKVSKVNTSVPVTYSIVDLNNEAIRGTFYNEELKKTKIPDYVRIDKIIARKKVNGVPMIRVKYKGYDNSFNQWIPLSDTQKF